MIGFDRFLMGFTLGAHILIVTLSISLSLIVSIAEFLAIRKKDPHYEVLSRRLAKALVIFFAVGTASGTVLAVELFTLWPTFMVLIAKVDILPFYYEVFAFFLEAISLVLYVYYWDYFRNRYHHWLLSLFVAIGTVMSAVFITMINAFMNTPSGFNIPAYLASNGSVLIGINPLAAVASPSAFVEVSHVVTATLTAGSFALLTYLAVNYYRSKSAEARDVYRKGINITAIVAFVSIILAGISGDASMRMLMSLQPLKYAAIELNFFHSQANAPELLGGIMINGKPAYYISLPGVQSIIAFLSFNSAQKVPGLLDYPSSLWPPLFVHLTFDTMVGGGILLGLFSLFLFYKVARKRNISGRFMYYGMITAGILAEIIYDAGWVTDEVGRQPWIIYNVMTVNSAANTSPSVIPLGIGIIIFYLIVVPFTFYFTARVLKNESVERQISEVRNRL
ncbi:MAG: cytochrome ubiquinol oxidase subunit I [Candidatus Thermoplasmatota archaeon]|nr:cytochrome ubiquinol oxidase subunit I [Candidatus Thermoplasmatota archaeon]